MLVEILLFLTLLLVYAVIKDRKPRNMPPGPMEIPFIGNRPLQYTTEMRKYREKYGNIYTTRLGSERFVMLCDYKTAKQALGSGDVADRGGTFTLFSVNSNEPGGVLASNGSPWIHDRRFVLRNLRDLGMGKTYLEQAILIEAQALVDNIKSLGEKPVSFPRSFRTTVLNVVWQMIASKRYELDSIEVDQIFIILEDLRNESFLVFFEYFFPILSFLPAKLKNNLLGTAVIKKFTDEMRNIIKKTVDEHERTLDITDPRDLIDEYLIEMKQQEDSENSNFRYEALENIVSDLFAAGSDTVTTTLKWVVYYMVSYPNTVKRCQEEIDDVVPANTMVSIQQRPELPYVEAFVAETLRHSSMVFMGVQRFTNKDTTLQGYFIPKGTSINTDAFFIHHDPEFWDNPDDFRPERYLDEEGKFQNKVGRSLAFGSGRRQCVGEALARMELYLFTASMLQNFTVELPPGKTLNTKILESIGLRLPVDQELVYKCRN